MWNGVAVTLVDTAGTRTTTDAIEVRGIELGERRVESADVVIVVNDGVAPWNDGSRYPERAVVVRSKADLAATATDGLATSAVTGLGLEQLKQRVLELAGVAAQEGSEDPFITTERQFATIAVARDALAAAVSARQTRKVSEVVALELRQAANALAQLRGTEVGERVLDEVFARFCIGK